MLTEWTPFKWNYLGRTHTGFVAPCPGPSSKVVPYFGLHSSGSDPRVLGTQKEAEGGHAAPGGILTPAGVSLVGPQKEG